jgi:hypothetical protein
VVWADQQSQVASAPESVEAPQSQQVWEGEWGQALAVRRFHWEWEMEKVSEKVSEKESVDQQLLFVQEL